MTQRLLPPDELLVGVTVTPERVEAQLVEVTPFGRLRSGGRRVVEDNDALGAPRTIPRAGAEHGRGDADASAATWVECIANAISKLTFGLPARRLRLGVALDGDVHQGGRTVHAVGSVAPVVDFAAALTKALRGRSCAVSSTPPIAIGLAEAWALGEQWSAIGALVDGGPGLVLFWDRSVQWIALEPTGQRRLDVSAREARLGFDGLARARERMEPRPVVGQILSAARKGDPLACGLLRGAAEALAARAAELLEHRAGGAALERVVLGGTIGRAALDERLADLLRLPFEVVLDPISTPDAEEFATPPGAVFVSREAAATAIGAAAHALTAATDVAGPNPSGDGGGAER